MHPVFTGTVLKQAARASREAYNAKNHTHVAGECEAMLVDYGDGPLFGIQGTEFDGSGIVFGDMMIDGLAYPWHDPYLGWLHKGFLMGRALPRPIGDGNKGGARGLFRTAFADLKQVHERLFVVGHSKAAAQAPIVAGFLTAFGCPPRGVIAIDAPRFAAGDGLARVLKKVPVLHIRIPASPVNRYPKMPYWHYGPGEVLELGPPAGFIGDITAHKIANIERLIAEHVEAAGL